MENPRTALHIAAANDDVDGVCRLIEWGADVNIRDNKKYAPYLYPNSSSCIKEPVRLDCKIQKQMPGMTARQRV